MTQSTPNENIKNQRLCSSCFQDDFSVIRRSVSLLVAFIIIINIIIIVEIKRFIYFILDANPSLPVHHREPSNHLQLPVETGLALLWRMQLIPLEDEKRFIVSFRHFWTQTKEIYFALKVCFQSTTTAMYLIIILILNVVLQFLFCSVQKHMFIARSKPVVLLARKPLSVWIFWSLIFTFRYNFLW